jgi:outer membrane protein assembly factor BamB
MTIRNLLTAAALMTAATLTAPAQVFFDRILKASNEPQNWLTYSGALNGQRYSTLAQITPANAKNLELKWVLQTRAPAEADSKYEATSLVVDGVLYTVQPPNVVVALDAATGRIFWTALSIPPPPRASAAAASIADSPSSATPCSWGRSTGISLPSMRAMATTSGAISWANPKPVIRSPWRRSW